MYLFTAATVCLLVPENSVTMGWGKRRAILGNGGGGFEVVFVGFAFIGAVGIFDET